jgi:copper chaperone CopZ
VITQLTIAGMRSVHSVRAVYTTLTAVEGITHAEVRLGSAEITHDGRATCAALRAAVELAGYEVESCREDRRRLT